MDTNSGPDNGNIGAAAAMGLGSDLSMGTTGPSQATADDVGPIDPADQEEDDEDQDDRASDSRIPADSINHRVSLTYQNKLQLLRIFVNLRPLYLDPSVSKTLFWKRVNDEISQELQLPFKSSVYTVKRLVKRRRAQVSHHKLHPDVWFRKVALDDLVDEVIAVFDEEKQKKQKQLDSKKAITSEKKSMRKSILASKLAEESQEPGSGVGVGVGTGPHLASQAPPPAPPPGLPMVESFTSFLHGSTSNTSKSSDGAALATSPQLLPTTTTTTATNATTPLLTEILDSVNHLHSTLSSGHLEAQCESVAREVKALREFTYAEFRNIHSKLDLIYSRLK